MNFDIDLPDGMYKIKGDGGYGSPDKRCGIYDGTGRFYFWAQIENKRIRNVGGTYDIIPPHPTDFSEGVAHINLIEASRFWNNDLRSLIVSDLLVADEWADEFKVKL